MDFFVWNPVGGWVVGGVWLVLFAWALARGRGRATEVSLLVAGVAWTCYGFWEWHAKARGYNIRVDLFIIYPVLGVLSLVALVLLLASVQQAGPHQ